MPRALGALAVAAFMIVAAVPVAGQQSAFTPRDETPEEFPPGPGRDDTFYACTACHGFKLVAQQGMSRRQWEESIALMVDKHGMAPLPDEDRKIVLDYLETTYPPGTADTGRGSPNPFLNR